MPMSISKCPCGTNHPVEYQNLLLKLTLVTKIGSFFYTYDSRVVIEPKESKEEWKGPTVVQLEASGHCVWRFDHLHVMGCLPLS